MIDELDAIGKAPPLGGLLLDLRQPGEAVAKQIAMTG
jgi:hypothetical protein